MPMPWRARWVRLFLSSSTGVLALAGCARNITPPRELLATARDEVFRKEPPAVVDTPLLPRLAFESVTLSNGLAVVFHRTELPVAAVAWSSRAAHDDGVADEAGIALATARLLGERVRLRILRDPAAGDATALLPSARVNGIGTTFEVVTLPFVWKQAVEELATMVTQPALEPLEDFMDDKHLQDLLHAPSGNGLTKLRRTALESVWGRGNPQALPIDGASSGLTYSVQTIRNFQMRTYVPSESQLVVVGPFTLDEVVAEAAAAFGNWAKPNAPAHVDVAETPPVAAPDDRLRISGLRRAPGAGPALLTIAAPCTGLQDADDMAFEVLSNFLDGFSFSSQFRLQRVEYGGSYYLHSNCLERRAAGTFTIELDAPPREIDRTLRALLLAFDRLRTTELDARELDIAKRRYLGGWQERLSSSGGIARAVAGYFSGGSSPQALTTLEERVRAVTSTRVRAVAQRFLSPRNLAIVVSGNPDELDEPLSRIGMVTWQNAVDSMDLPSQYWGEERD
jgi:predicted Zn-dependent peptidase